MGPYPESLHWEHWLNPTPAPAPAPGCLTQHPFDPGRAGRASENPESQPMTALSALLRNSPPPRHSCRGCKFQGKFSHNLCYCTQLVNLFPQLPDQLVPQNSRRHPPCPPPSIQGRCFLAKSRMSKFLHPGWTRPPSPRSPAGCWLCSFPNVDDAGSQQKTPGTPSGATRRQHPQHPPHQRAHPHHCR